MSLRAGFLIVQYYTLTVNAFCKPPPPPPPPSPPPPVAQKIVLRGVHFNFDKAIIRDVDKPVLDEAAETLKANPNAKIYVNGYCDAIGGMRYNQGLSERRANAVAAYLEDKGIPSSQLIPRGFGKTHFVAPNDTADGRAQNRRVEVVPAQEEIVHRGAQRATEAAAVPHSVCRITERMSRFRCYRKTAGSPIILI